LLTSEFAKVAHVTNDFSNPIEQGLRLFMVKKEVFEWIRTGQKTNKLGRRGRGKKSSEFLFP